MSQLPKLITDSPTVLRYQQLLESELTRRGQAFQANYQTRGVPDGMRHPAYYFNKYNIYWKSGDSSTVNRYWNSFGVDRPSELRDAFQVNVPKSGVNRRIQGGFLRDGAEVLLLHRGALGGGRKDGTHNLCDMVPELKGRFDDGTEQIGILIPLFDQNGALHPNFFDRVKIAIRAAANELARR